MYDENLKREKNYKKLESLKKINSNSFHTSGSWNPNMAEKDKNNYKSIKARARFKRPVYHLTCEKVM